VCGKEDGIKWLHPFSSSGKVDLNEPCHLSGWPFVTTGEDQGSLVSMSFALGNHIEAREIPGEEYITHADVSLGDAIADPWIGHGKRKGIPYPETSNSLLYEILI
jgi:hypothetical protein